MLGHPKCAASYILLWLAFIEVVLWLALLGVVLEQVVLVSSKMGSIGDGKTGGGLVSLASADCAAELRGESTFVAGLCLFRAPWQALPYLRFGYWL